MDSPNAKWFRKVVYEPSVSSIDIFNYFFEFIINIASGATDGGLNINIVDHVTWKAKATAFGIALTVKKIIEKVCYRDSKGSYQPVSLFPFFLLSSTVTDKFLL